MCRSLCRRGWCVAALCSTAGLGAVVEADEFQFIARTGWPAPYGSGVQFNQFLANGPSLPRPQIAYSGATSFHAVLSGAGVNASNRLTISRWSQGGIDPVWRQGDQAVGLPFGVQFTGVSRLSMNDAGDVSFIGSLSGIGVIPGVNDRGVWVAHTSAPGLSLLAREGSLIALLGYPTSMLRRLNNVELAGPGELGPAIVTCDLDVPDLGNGIGGVVVQSSGGFNVAAIANMQLPDALPNTFILAATPLVSAGGIGGYQCSLTGSGVGQVEVSGVTIITDRALVSGYAPDLRTVARSGWQAPTEPVGVVFWHVWGGSARSAVSPAGRIVFSASLAGPGVDSSNWWGIWQEVGAGLTRMLRYGDVVPQVGATVAGFTLPSGASALAADEDGRVVTTALLAGPGISFSNNAAILCIGEHDCVVVARAGSAVAGLPSGVVFQNSSFGLGARFGRAGHVALAARLEGPGVSTDNDVAVMLWSPEAGTLARVCREGDRVGPYRVLTLSHTGGDLQVNGQGRIVFSATVLDTREEPESAMSRTAVLTAAPGEAARIIAVEGAAVTVGSEQVMLRTVRIGAAGSINDLGHVVLAAAIDPPVPLDEAVLRVGIGPAPPPCPADHDDSGLLEVSDIFAFLGDWFAGAADFDGNGETDVHDIFAFLAAWFAGCPA
ncbi:MAG: hypothetical protein KF699_13145 [Phycisphaeraceae bacterium]|nr:hypothetical protein [Phycisphaeraceae bacterium]